MKETNENKELIIFHIIDQLLDLIIDFNLSHILFKIGSYFGI
uniref:Uncharacterized protein n=1 Tax=Ascaris lumbricoides TaxID=6252 RepID=A0A0M3I8X9_ASCLU